MHNTATTPKINTEDYAKHLTDIIAVLASDQLNGRDIDIDMMVCALEPNRPENRKVRDFAVKTLRIRGADFDSAMRRNAARSAGFTANTARELVECFVEKNRISASYNGLLRMNAVPYLRNDDGTVDYIPPRLWEDYEFKTMIQTNFRRIIGFDELARSVRIISDEYKMLFSHASLDDASQQWYSDICRDRLWRIMGSIDYVDTQDTRDKGQHQLKQLAETCFECEHGADFVVAMFNKFIWQVKRKIENMPIFNHLMLVILGSQGTGKSTLIRNLLGPVDELHAMTDFKAITDDRNISLWRNFVIFLDEMGWASKSDMDTVKNIITANTLTRRVMRTNVTQEVAQNATFIGAANADELAELIRDATGTRRFVSLTMKDASDREVINAMDWSAVWQSVDHAAEDPMARFRRVLQTVQAADRTKSTVEEWVNSLEPSDRSDAQSLNNALRHPARKFTSSELHNHFSDYERLRFPGQKGTSITDFGRKLNKLCRQPNGRFVNVGKPSNALFEWRDANEADVGDHLDANASRRRQPRLV